MSGAAIFSLDQETHILHAGATLSIFETSLLSAAHQFRIVTPGSVFFLQTFPCVQPEMVIWFSNHFV
jgi:hypothetical protein